MLVDAYDASALLCRESLVTVVMVLLSDVCKNLPLVGIIQIVSTRGHILPNKASLVGVTSYSLY